MTVNSGRRLAALAGLAVLIGSGAGGAEESLLERGRYLVQGIAACGNCHTPRTPDGPVPGMELAGGFLVEMEPFTAYAANITPDVETGIGGWSETELIAAIRDGRRPNGEIIGPPMPIELYRNISDRDAEAIAAYIRSVPAVRNAVPRTEYRIPLPESYGPPVAGVADVPRTDKVAYGAYLAGPLGHCIECHTPRVAGHPDFENQLGAGGAVLDGPWGAAVSRNITPHPEDGIGGWTDEEIKRAITQGIGADGNPLSPPMGFAYYRTMRDEDLDALVSYLRSLAPRPWPK